ncbi:hypothetical protein [Modestobacter sp. URMC 112]
MSERSDDPVEPDEGSHASTGGDVERPGGGRTAAESSVDEAMGAEDEPTS